ncbi:MAG: glycosyltransferase [Muribaculaceae bacterium]|nr:glycosyltransferase [Muribaculaceae bacterium]
MNRPKLSLILPIYNVSQYIERCLQSIFQNDFDDSDIELILVDDASPDNSVEIALSWLNKNGHTNFKLITQENKGLGGARNTGIDNASAPWIWFIDSDDEITPRAIPIILKNLNQSLDFISFNALSLPSKTLAHPTLKKPIEHVHAEDLASKYLLNSPCFNIYNIAFLKNKGLRFKEKFLHEDNEFSIRVNYFADKLSLFPESIYIYNTQNASSITNAVNPKKVDDLMAHFDTYDRLITLHPSPKQLRAMQLENTVPFYWLWNLRLKATGNSRQKLDKIFSENRWRFVDAFSQLSLKQRFSIYLHTTIWYPKLKKLLNRI